MGKVWIGLAVCVVLAVLLREQSVPVAHPPSLPVPPSLPAAQISAVETSSPTPFPVVAPSLVAAPEVVNPFAPQARTPNVASAGPAAGAKVGGKDYTVSFLTSKAGVAQLMTFHGNPDARPRLLAQVLGFLDRSSAHQGRYEIDTYDCKHFAHKLFEEAQAAGFDSAFVGFTIQNYPTGHAVVAFRTSDAGNLFGDFTPRVRTSTGEQFPTKKIVYVKDGEAYVRIPLEKIPADFKNTASDFVQFRGRQLQAQTELERYNLEAKNLQDLNEELNNQILAFNESTKAFTPEDAPRFKSSVII